jgi:transcriptional regulator with XRE-family HTH domain
MDDEAIRRGRFAVRLADLRSDSGLSFDALGVEIGVAGETIRRWEQGAYAPRKKRDVVLLEEALGARTGELWALLKGYEIPAKHPRRADPDTDQHLVAAIFDELQALREAIAELQSGQNGEPPESHRGSRTRVPVPSQRAS